MYTIGVDVGGTKAYVALLKNGIPVQRIPHISTKEAIKKDVLLEKIAVDGIQKVLEKEGIEYKDVHSIGYGIPGNIQKEKNDAARDGFQAGHILQCPNLPILNGVYLCHDMHALFQDEKGNAIHLMDNDANCLAKGAYHQLGLDKLYDSGVAGVCSTGVGFGFIHNKQLVSGMHTSAGEIGFNMYNSKRTIEEVCSGEALRELKVGTRKVADGQELYRLIKEGDKDAIAVGKRATLRHMGRLVEHLTRAYDPEFIVLSGSRTKITELFFDELKTYVSRKLGEQAPALYTCTDTTVNALGAAHLVPGEPTRTLIPSAPLRISEPSRIIPKEAL